MSAPRRWVRRAMLSMLAGGGLSAASFGGPLAGGALGAEAQTGTTTTEDQAPAVTETTPQAPASTPEASGAGETSSSAGAEGSGSAGSSTTSTTPAPSSTATTPSAPATGATPTTAAEAAAPTVVVQHSQPTTPGRRRGANVTGAGNGTSGGAGGAGANGAEGANSGPSTAPAGAVNGVAPAPQAAGDELDSTLPELATLLTGSTVSAQALDFYRIPLFLLPVYQAAAFQYDVPWQILAAINEIETDYGTDLSLSTAGAEGWMQFMPATWLQYGVDATDAGYADPYNPVDAIFAAARYLQAADVSHHLRAAIFSYNHSMEYVESVMLRAHLIASYPSSVIGTLTGLVDGRAPTIGAHLALGAVAAAEAIGTGTGAAGEGSSPSAAAGAAGGSSNATAGAVPAALPPTPAAAGAQAGGSTQPGAAGAASGNSAAHSAAVPGSTPAPSPQVAARRAQAAANAPAKPSQLTDLLGDPGAPVVAVEDGRIMHLGRSRALGRYLVLRDIYGDVFTYAGLGSIAPRYRPSVPREQTPAAGASDAAVGTSVSASTAASATQSGAAATGTGSGEPAQDPAPTLPASAGHQSPLTLKVKGHAPASVPASAPVEAEGENVPAGMGKVRLFAHPANPVARTAAAHAAHAASTGGGWVALRTGSIVSKGTVLGRLDTPPGASAGQLRFAVRPAGDSTPIDPQPLLANWRQLGAALHPKGSKNSGTLVGATAGDALQMSKAELERAVLADPGIQLDTCGRRDVAGGTVDRRVLAALVFLSRSGLQPAVAGLRCPRGGDSPSGLSVVAGAGASASAALRSAAGQAAVHSGGIAVDITAINGIPIAGHQGSGTVTDAAIRALLTLHGRFAPHRIVSLMRYPGVPATQAQAAAWNHIHIEFLPARPSATAHTASAGPAAAAPLAATGELNGIEWSQLIGRIAALPKPTVSVTPSSAAIRDPQAAPTTAGLAPVAWPATDPPATDP
jgi:hypothetical protein